MQPQHPALAGLPLAHELGELEVLDLDELRTVAIDRLGERGGELPVAVRAHLRREPRRVVAIDAAQLDQVHGVQAVHRRQAAGVVESRLVADEDDVVCHAQAAQQLGDAARAAVPRGIHRERRDEQHARSPRAVAGRRPQPAGVRRAGEDDAALLAGKQALRQQRRAGALRPASLA